MPQNDMLSELLGDPEKLQSAIAMASSLLGGDGANENGASPSQDHTEYQSVEEDPSSELMQKAMPVLAEIVRNGQRAVSAEKKELLHAVKPFVSDTVRTQIDHGLRLVSLARMARAAMKQLEGKSADLGNGGTHV